LRTHGASDTDVDPPGTASCSATIARREWRGAYESEDRPMDPTLRTASLSLLLAAPAWALAVQDCELNGQAVNPANGYTTAAKSGLMRCKDRDSGELQREQELQNGVFMGVVRYYEHGKLVKEHSVNAKGNMEGRAREYAPTSGTVIRDATYRNGTTVGLVRAFYPGGTLRRATFYDDNGAERAYAEYTERGQIDSLHCADKPVLAPAADDAALCGFATNGAPSSVEFFDARGQQRSRASYVAGKRVKSDMLYDNGKPSLQELVDGNQRIERRWSAEGVQLKETVWLLVERGSVKQREREYSEHGTLVREQRWTNGGAALSDESYYLNGQPRSKSTFSGEGPSRFADVVEFHDNGQRAKQGRYAAADGRREVPVGTHQSFDAAGTLVAESVYDDKGRVTRERTWNAAGQPLRDDEVFEDGSRKAYAR
jgi:antitoxin component YwqK of YwqJK toxin-antitoxin module